MKEPKGIYAPPGKQIIEGYAEPNWHMLWLSRLGNVWALFTPHVYSGKYGTHKTKIRITIEQISE